MTEKEKQERKSIQLEIRARKEVLKKIETVFKRLRMQAEANLEKRKQKVRAAREYKSIDEAHEEWGYAFITDKQFEEIKKVFELGDEYVEKHISTQEAAVKILGRLIEGLNIEIRSFELELCSAERQARVGYKK